MNESVMVTIVVPTFNRCNDLARCLDSLVQQTYDNFEILVVDNGSTDDTPKLLRKYPVRVIKDLTRNLTHVFNIGWRNAPGQIVAWINDDAEATPSWIESIVLEFEHHPNASAVGGPTLAMRKQSIHELHEMSHRSKFLTPFGRVYEAVIAENGLFEIGRLFRSGAYSIGGSLPLSTKLKEPVFVDMLTITNMAIRKEILRDLGGFDESFLFNHADGDLFVRMRKSGRLLLFSPKVVVFHHVNPTGAVRNARNLGRDQAYFYLKDFDHEKTPNSFPLLLNALFFNIYWIFEAMRKGNPRALNGILGFASGVMAYYGKSHGPS
ncbi:MAG: hypothetical protein AUJ07_08570 [Crenarchaeota archaeon 13_1_40CM_3_53_5]|nr:MAG: hypothetical protein AUJ07_08570 [Crenarchaeota archaeon 13_1_40CM_3_53_5]